MFVAPRKQIRLTPDRYLGQAIYFVTICAENRRPIFNYAKRGAIAIEALRQISAAQFFIHAFCLTPDHAHLLAEGRSPGSDLVRFVAQWKQSTGYLFRDELSKRLWQRRFYDHILRHAEDSDAIAWYIWMNPVRKGLVAEPQQYPFSGSFTVEWPKAASAGSGSWIPPCKQRESRTAS